MNGLFGEVELDYEDMYSGLYMEAAPALFPQVVANMCGYASTKQCPQDEWWAMANDIAEERNLDAYSLACDKETLFVYLVNYKGEGEGLFKYEDVKDKIRGTFVSKYNYM